MEPIELKFESDGHRTQTWSQYINCNEFLYFSQVVVHISNTISEEPHDPDSQEEGSGLDNVLSGSGDREHNDLILDDEDLELHPLKVNIKCEMHVENSVIQPSPQPVSPVK